MILATLVSVSTYAAPPAGGPPPPTPPPPGLPINDGVLYLLAAGLLYGVYFIRKSTKTQKA
ncbi:hypothetical protein NAT51_17715 [Flavobacterium amniphilum]|uniref:hypothetical protein n=1 Tax=Flavobacterium amniphilum TaxID=1834035 RepID=UPI00202A0100|nr:hypothetical protein [Flavobacterium amniphilum]MCL9807369.1 hypothetical protein [Flavobacterium amniphilum]